MTIDVDRLRSDLINDFGSATPIYNIAYADVTYLQNCSDQEIVSIALRNGYNLSDYEIMGYSL